ncbi:uncharacterized protein [Nicotiana tomentosiformis]|uniref:uncharacterized protein n=1 Tax=Nicotiana tomentosiformis TaxID=4098 RepID=UPI00388C4445
MKFQAHLILQRFVQFETYIRSSFRTLGYISKVLASLIYSIHAERVYQKGVMRFAKKGKLSPRFIGPFEVLRRVGEVAYEVALPPSLARVHPVFYVSKLWKYHGDPAHVLDFSLIQLDKDLSYVEEPVAILDRHVRKLRSKNIISVKAQWRG